MAAEKDILQELGEEAPELAKLLGNIKKEAPYKVPQDYFETLKLPPLHQAAVRSISFDTRILKYAAAAAIIGIIALTAWFTMQPIPAKNTVTLAKNDSSSLNNIQSISDDEMERYIDGDISVANYEPGNSVTDIKDEDLALLLTDIPDKELESFLN